MIAEILKQVIFANVLTDRLQPLAVYKKKPEKIILNFSKFVFLNSFPINYLFKY
jgi:hypothetical protein